MPAEAVAAIVLDLPATVRAGATLQVDFPDGFVLGPTLVEWLWRDEWAIAHLWVGADERFHFAQVCRWVSADSELVAHTTNDLRLTIAPASREVDALDLRRWRQSRPAELFNPSHNGGWRLAR